MSTTTDPRNHKVIADPTELRQARQVVEQSASSRPDHWVATVSPGTTATLPPELSAMVTDILRIVARGGSVTVGSMPEDVTTTVAAELLGVSRPTLMKLVAEGAVPATKVGSHTRLKSADVLEFRRARLERQRAAFERLLELEDSG